MINRIETRIFQGDQIGKPESRQISASDIGTNLQRDLKRKFKVVSLEKTDRAVKAVLEKLNSERSKSASVTYTGPAKLFRKSLKLLEGDLATTALS